MANVVGEGEPSYFKTLYRAIVVEGGMQISDDGVFRSLPQGMIWIDSSNVMLIRECWKQLFSIMLSKKSIILKGKAGRGKSLFILCVIFEILHCAKRNVPSLLCPAAGFFPSDPRIVYVDRGNKRHVVTLSGVYSLSGYSGEIHYYFSDNVDIPDAIAASSLTMAATSGDTVVLKEYAKRIECTKPEDGVTLCMPSLELEEMRLLFPDFEPEELQFKYDIIGGNPRKMFSKNLRYKKDGEYVPPVIRVVRMVFGEEYEPTSDGELTKKQALGAWAISSVVRELAAAVAPIVTTDSSFFKDYSLVEDFELGEEQYSSRFLRLVAGSLKESVDKDVMMKLESIFGHCGIGYAFEFTAHKQLMGSSGTRWCRKSTGNNGNKRKFSSQNEYEYEQLDFGRRSTFLIRNVGDIKHLPVDSYGLPTVSNFPFIDAVLPPNIGLQMTTSVSHGGAIGALPNILHNLRIQQSDFKMVFVIPDENLPRFDFPKDLGAVQMYVTNPAGSTEETFKKLCEQPANR